MKGVFRQMRDEIGAYRERIERAEASLTLAMRQLARLNAYAGRAHARIAELESEVERLRRASASNEF